jgi:DNA-binding MarR family transcriptional regulator
MDRAEPPLGRNVTEARATIGALLRLPYEVLAERLYGGLAEAGFPDIRRAHSAVFRHIAPSGSRLTELAERAGMTKQSMAYLLETLVAGGYATSLADPQDGRARIVRLTAKGRRVQQELLRRGAAAEEECARAMGTEDYERLRDLLGRLIAALGAEAPGP